MSQNMRIISLTNVVLSKITIDISVGSYEHVILCVRLCFFVRLQKNNCAGLKPKTKIMLRPREFWNCENQEFYSDYKLK